MSALDGGKLFTGPATVVFGGAEISHATEVEIRLEPKVLEAPDVAKAGGPLDITCPQKGITIFVRDASVTVDSVAAASGYSTISQVGGAKVLTFDEAVRTLPHGSVSVAFSRNDGTSCRLFLKRVVRVPQSQAAALSKSSFTNFSYAFVKLDPADGTNVAGQFEEGDASVSSTD